VKLLRRLVFDDPAETRFFLFLAAFALVIGAIYWFVSYEPAGSALLLAFGAATGVMAVVLHRRGRHGDDRPFLDETGRLPSETPAPLAVGAGLALMALAFIFGPALLLVGLLPFGWGAWTWLGRARAELDATAREDIS
jgi:membrane associated rhomboid family serine protease